MSFNVNALWAKIKSEAAIVTAIAALLTALAAIFSSCAALNSVNIAKDERSNFYNNIKFGFKIDEQDGLTVMQLSGADYVLDEIDVVGLNRGGESKALEQTVLVSGMRGYDGYKHHVTIPRFGDQYCQMAGCNYSDIESFEIAYTIFEAHERKAIVYINRSP